MPAGWDRSHFALAGGLCFVSLLWLFEAYRVKSAVARARAAEDELLRIKNRPRTHEFRVERPDAVWYPSVLSEKATGTILEVKTGVPHCRGCGLPLASGGGGFSCGKCSSSYPAALASEKELAEIGGLARRWFEARHPDLG